MLLCSACMHQGHARRAQPRITAFFESGPRKPGNKWEAGDAYYDAVVRTIPEVFSA